MQVKLLRVLESRQVMRVGGTRTARRRADHHRLRKWTQEDGRRNATSSASRPVLPDERVSRVLPPLRERREDVPLFAESISSGASRRGGRSRSRPTPSAHCRYDWPGNVRELRNIMQRLALFAESGIGVEDLPAEIALGSDVAQLAKACTRCLVDGDMSYTEVVACLERNLLRQALAEAGSRTQAARVLGLSLSTLRDKLKKHGARARPPEGLTGHVVLNDGLTRFRPRARIRSASPLDTPPSAVGPPASDIRASDITSCDILHRAFDRRKPAARAADFRRISPKPASISRCFLRSVAARWLPSPGLNRGRAGGRRVRWSYADVPRDAPRLPPLG